MGSRSISGNCVNYVYTNIIHILFTYYSHIIHIVPLVLSEFIALFLIRFKNITLLVGGLENDFYFSIYWECHHPN